MAPFWLLNWWKPLRSQNSRIPQIHWLTANESQRGWTLPLPEQSADGVKLDTSMLEEKITSIVFFSSSA